MQEFLRNLCIFFRTIVAVQTEADAVWLRGHRMTGRCAGFLSRCPPFILIYDIIFVISASCKICEKFNPIDIARSFSHDGMVRVFFTAFVSLY